MASSERDRALALSERWINEAVDQDHMAGQSEYTPDEARDLRLRAEVKRECARDLRVEMWRISRGR